MNWDAISAVGEMVSAVAVVTSIVYLALQVRTSTRVEKARASFDASHSWAATTDLLMGLPDDTLLPLMTVFRTDFDPEALPDAEFHRIVLMWRSIGQKLEGQYFLYKYGLVEEDLWQKRSSIFKGFIELPFGADWWRQEQQVATFSSEFVNVINRAPGIDASEINLRPD